MEQDLTIIEDVCYVNISGLDYLLNVYSEKEDLKCVVIEIDENFSKHIGDNYNSYYSKLENQSFLTLSILKNKINLEALKFSLTTHVRFALSNTIYSFNVSDLSEIKNIEIFTGIKHHEINIDSIDNSALFKLGIISKEVSPSFKELERFLNIAVRNKPNYQIKAILKTFKVYKDFNRITDDLGMILQEESEMFCQLAYKKLNY
ncbi:MAG TPA: hypothetical protein VK071_08345 [Tissierellales bacterium]|nr:hypothetical protein [Tissierellales bacterium]